MRYGHDEEFRDMWLDDAKYFTVLYVNILCTYCSKIWIWDMNILIKIRVAKSTCPKVIFIIII